MSESLIPLFCVAKVSAETVSSIIQTAYAGSPDTLPSIFLLLEPALLVNPQTAQPSNPPITDLSSHPFLSHSVQDLVTFLDSNNPEPAISSHQFLIADKQTNEDHSVLFVNRGYEPDDTPQTVRLDATYANAIPVAVQVATMDLDGVRALVDDDGVYRGGPSQPAARKGEPTPRMQLGEGDGGASGEQVDSGQA